MTIIAPTIDRFDETTVMRMLRKLIGWIKDDLIEQINNNDIASVDKTVDGMSFNIDLVKGDGTKIPVGQITLDDSDKNVSSGEFTFDTNNRKLSGTLVTGDGSEIEIPAVTIPAGTGGDVDDFVSGAFNYSDNQLTLTLNRESGTNPLVVPPVTIVSGGGGTGGNPYPTAISGTVSSTGQIQLSITMSEGSPLTGNIDMSYFASVEDLEEIQTQLTDITISTTVSQDSTNVIKVSNAVNGNSADLKLDLAIVGTDIILTAENGDGTQQAITKINYNDIIPKTKKLVTSGDITQFVTTSPTGITINKDFDMEVFYRYSTNNNFYSHKISFSKGTYNFGNYSERCVFGCISVDGDFSGIWANATKVTPYIKGSSTNVSIIYTEDVTLGVNNTYRLYA